jgi:hypothetical protein
MSELVLDPAQPVEFKPAEVTYYLRAPTVADRARFRHAVAAQGSKRWSFFELVGAVRKAIAGLAATGEVEADYDAWLALLDGYRERVSEAAAAMRAENSQAARDAFMAALTAPAEVEPLVRLARDTSAEVAGLLADNALHDLVAGTEAARMFLVGWDGLGRFGRGPTGATDAALWQVPESDLVEIGRKVAELLEPRPDRLGNSASPSTGSAMAASSPTPATTPQSSPSPAATDGPSAG